MDWNDVFSSFVYPPCLVSALLCGLVFRRWVVAVVTAAILAPILDIGLSHMFADAPPLFDVEASTLFCVVAALEALLVWTLARAISRRRR